jgi:hypothetical protein
MVVLEEEAEEEDGTELAEASCVVSHRRGAYEIPAACRWCRGNCEVVCWWQESESGCDSEIDRRLVASRGCAGLERQSRTGVLW